MIEFDLGGLVGLADDVRAGARQVAKAEHELVEQTAIDMRDAWRANATASAGAHGRWYPSSIRYKMVGFASPGADIGPAEGMRQAAMSFEYGSANQPPHLDGQRALDEVAPRFVRRASTLRFL